MPPLMRYIWSIVYSLSSRAKKMIIIIQNNVCLEYIMHYICIMHTVRIFAYLHVCMSACRHVFTCLHICVSVCPHLCVSACSFVVSFCIHACTFFCCVVLHAFMFFCCVVLHACMCACGRCAVHPGGGECILPAKDGDLYLCSVLCLTL